MRRASGVARPPDGAVTFAGTATGSAVPFVFLAGSDAAFGKNPGDRLTDWHNRALCGHDLTQGSTGGRFNFHRGLVGLDFKQRVALLDERTLGHEPLRDSARRHVHIDFGENDFGRHDQRFP
jgi:hypothetical protein